MTTMRTCTHCKRDKPITEFTKNASKPDGFNTWCRQCANWHSRLRWRRDKANPEVRAQRRVRRAFHRLLHAGLLTKPTHCPACARETIATEMQGLHHDLTKLLEVVWRCRSCVHHARNAIKKDLLDMHCTHCRKAIQRTRAAAKSFAARFCSIQCMRDGKAAFARSRLSLDVPIMANQEQQLRMEVHALQETLLLAAALLSKERSIGRALMAEALIVALKHSQRRHPPQAVPMRRANSIANTQANTPSATQAATPATDGQAEAAQPKANRSLERQPSTAPIGLRELKRQEEEACQVEQRRLLQEDRAIRAQQRDRALRAEILACMGIEFRS